VVGDAVVRRFGRAQLAGFWLAVSIGLGAVGTLRNLAMQRSLGVSPARVSIPGLYTLLITAVLVILSVPTLALVRRASRGASSTPLIRRFLAGIGWTFGGLLVAVALAIGLDLANIPFIPIH
jgi:hypothetical protein